MKTVKTRIALCDGKYTLVVHDDGSFIVLRYDEPWRSEQEWIGDHFMHALVAMVVNLHKDATTAATDAPATYTREAMVRMAQFGAELAYLNKELSIERLQDECEHFADGWITHATTIPGNNAGCADEVFTP